jgi:hypothetical protein
LKDKQWRRSVARSDVVVGHKTRISFRDYGGYHDGEAADAAAGAADDDVGDLDLNRASSLGANQWQCSAGNRDPYPVEEKKELDGRFELGLLLTEGRLGERGRWLLKNIWNELNWRRS